MLQTIFKAIVHPKNEILSFIVVPNLYDLLSSVDQKKWDVLILIDFCFYFYFYFFLVNLQ